jgi:hypothetical protein
MKANTPWGHIHFGNEFSFVQILIAYRKTWIEGYLTTLLFLTLLWQTEKCCIYLFIYGAFNNAVNGSNYVVLNSKMISEWWTW